jgi:[ribosomal protein S5]-alanine N-acetyltransferase
MKVESICPPKIEIAGACLRLLRADDVDALYAYLSNPLVTQLTSFPEVTRSLAEAIVERTRSRWKAGELSKWGIALRENDQIVGTCGFNEWSRDHRWAELAYDLAPEQWGKGMMREAVAAVLHWIFERDEIDRVQAFVRVDNDRSKGLLTRSGFAQEGRLRGFRVCQGQPHDFYIYSLLRGEWTGTWRQ